MTDREDSFRSQGSPLAILQRFVPGSRRERTRLEPNEVLKGLLSDRSEEAAPTADGPDIGRDPAREAAMNQVRRMRIRAA